MISVRRKDREISREAALEVVDRCEYAVISMTDPDGMPYCLPVSIVRDGEAIYFHSAREGFKLDCLRADPRVCVCCVGDTRRAEDAFTTAYESTILRGIAQPVEEKERKIHALHLLCLRHTPANMGQFEATIQSGLTHTAVWEIQIESITGKRKK